MYEYMHIVASFTHSHSLRHDEACLRLSRVLWGQRYHPSTQVVTRPSNSGSLNTLKR